MLYEYPQKKSFNYFCPEYISFKRQKPLFLFKHVYRNSTTVLNKGIRGSLDLPKIGIGIKILEMGPSY